MIKIEKKFKILIISPFNENLFDQMYKLFVSEVLLYYQFIRFLRSSMKIYQLFVSCTLTLLMVSCVSNKIDEAEPVSPADRPSPPSPHPQDGSFIVRPQGTSKVKLSKSVRLQASAAAQREVVRRQQAAKDADSEVQNAIQDLKDGSLTDARVKLRKAVQKYPRTGT